MLVRGFTDGIAIVPGPAGGLWATSVRTRVDGVHDVDGLGKARGRASLVLRKTQKVFDFLTRYSAATTS